MDGYGSAMEEEADTTGGIDMWGWQCGRHNDGAIEKVREKGLVCG